MLSVISKDYTIWSDYMLIASSNIDNIYWIYNQTVTPLLIIILILNNIPKQNMVFLYSLCYLHGPFCFIGFLPFFCIILFNDLVNNSIPSKSIIEKIKPYLTFQNIVGSITILVVSYFYLSGSPAVQSLFIEKIVLKKYLLFTFVMFGFISILIFKKYKKEPFFYTLLAMLLILPLIGIGDFQQFTFCARVSVVPMFILMILVTKFIIEEPSSRVKNMVITYVILASLEGFLAFGRSVTFTIWHYIYPLETNIYLYERAGEWFNWKNLVPDKREWKNQNFNILNFEKTQDTSANINIRYFELQKDSSIFNKYLLKN